MAETELLSLVEEMNLTGTVLPEGMVRELFECQGNSSDQKCCHCVSPIDPEIYHQRGRGERGTFVRKDSNYKTSF
ncbi:MAG: hypothetical protein NTW17_03200 [Candidatus Pacearchaeota archaeon]|nr:hypothetical protein [Candidatus Pacearchaeota archaeon]